MLFDFIKRYWQIVGVMHFFPWGGGRSNVIAYPIANSLRLRSSASANASRTFGTATTRNRWSWRGLVKIGDIASSAMTLFSSGDGTTSNYTRLQIQSGTIQFINVGAGTSNGTWQSSGVYRDPTGHYDILAVYDSANATAADRMIVYVNGVRLSGSFSTAAVSGANSWINSNNAHFIGRESFSATAYFDGLLSEIYLIDGQALTPSSFGQADPNNPNNWVPKAYTGTYGNNGFYLKFNDGTSLTTLGYDRSGNGNNWTLNNVSLTAGATYDWLFDTPTNNYATLNPLDKTSSIVLADGNLKVTIAGGTAGGSGSTFAVSSGKWAFEFTPTQDGAHALIGIVRADLSQIVANDLFTASAAYGYYGGNGNKYVNGVASAYGAAFTTETIRGELDCDNNTLEFFKSNVSQGKITIASGQTWKITLSNGNSASAIIGTFNFGQQPWTNTPTTGFKALCTANRPASSTIATSGTFNGSLSADGPDILIGGAPSALTINGNAVTFGTHADKTAGGFKLRTASSSYNNTGSNTWTATATVNFGKSNTYPAAAQGNP